MRNKSKCGMCNTNKCCELCYKQHFMEMKWSGVETDGFNDVAGTYNGTNNNKITNLPHF
jgi:hypothetical protein